MERGRSSKNQGSAKTTKSSTGNTRSTGSKAGSTAGRAGSKGTTGKKDNQSLLKEFFVEQLQDIYWAEKHLVKELPKLQKAATSEDVISALEEHTSITEEQVARLEEVFEMMEETAKAKKCEAMEGLTKEAHTVIEDTEDGSATRDVAIIMAAQKVEHYEIATYGSLVQLAKTLGQTDVAELLQQTLEEEKEADVLLTDIAESYVNEAGAQEEGNEGEEE
ncbi:YciE/YciF ferroxidase family protein [Longitalea arenae]|uniref:YciE/YciF ferroxidase family protein n=1 Tax=Longitalea arenae TaxID=2812558 RepID=UPI001967FEDC|nr:ferritin-like domain-containing protein [Longitalea arenae]